MLVRSLSDAKPQIYTVVLIRLPAQSKIVHMVYSILDFCGIMLFSSDFL